MVLKALILVGGYGTRLRPLTFSSPKPLVPFANKAIVLHQIEALVAVGVKEIILAVNYQPQVMVDYLKDCEAKYGVKIIISKEDEPLGTAGPVALAKEWLAADDEPFFMFNSDVICTFPLAEMLAFHRSHGKEGTILVTPVEDPSKYGVVVHDSETGEISQFIEKPKDFVGDKINAGLYLLNPAVIKRIKPRPTSIEREIFPAMAAEANLFCMKLPGYWMDIGQPKDYLRGMVLHLQHIQASAEAKDAEIRGNVLIDPSAKIGKGAVIGPNVVIGANVVVGEHVRIERSTLFDGVQVADGALIRSCIIGWETRVGRWARLEQCVIGKDVSFAAEITAKGVIVCPHKGVKQSPAEDEIIL